MVRRVCQRSEGRDRYTRVALDRVGVAAGAGGALLRGAALEEGVAVGVSVFGGTDVSVERVGGGADGQLLRSHWLCCWGGGIRQRCNRTHRN